MVDNRQPGLPSLNESRANRYRQITTGKTAIGGIPPKLFLTGLAVLAIGTFIYFRLSQSELDERRGTLLAKQRAVATVLGPKLGPLEATVGQSLTELKKGGDKSFVEPGVDWDKLLASPGLYLRLRSGDAGDAKRVRQAAGQSLRDGFTSCLLRDLRAEPPHQGKACTESTACDPGQLCNEYKVCQRPSSPFNMRLLYRALLVLSDEWTNEVKGAGTDLALLAYERGLDTVTRVDIPVAIEVYQRSRYAVLVLDEDPAGGVPAEIPDAFESVEERIQRVAHRARVGIFALPEGKLLARVTTEASGELRDVGTRAKLGGPEAAAARARQANSCGLALSVLAELRPELAAPTIEP